MRADPSQRQSRREFLSVSVVVPALALAGAHAVGAQAVRPAATPACGDGDPATPPETEGPYFKPRSPARTSLLEPDMPGPRIVVEGSVLGTDCRPLARALLDFWQADAAGRYDNTGFRLRGHQFTDDAGRYRLETVVPGVYFGRTRHIHVKVQAPHQAVLTTQLYFPGEPANRRDPLFMPALLLTKQDDGAAQRARFDFVLDLRRPAG
jgi:protocatechuate 3,4-dioxygenase beta subunit